MRPYIHKDFLLSTPAARELYHRFGEGQPIFDFHCHLSPKEIYENETPSDISQLWLAGDHYKWRAMRSCGVAEEYCTGNKSGREKFEKFAYALQYAIGNPLYHWAHLELQRYFDIDTPLSAKTADEIYDRANAKIKDGDFRPQSLIKNSNVKIVCTTDDPADSLEWHAKMAADATLETRVLPAFRREQEEIRRFAEEQSGRSIPVMKPWDVAFWSEKRRKALYDFDSEELRPYYSLPQVMEGMFSIYAGLYGIRFVERPTACLKEGEPLPEGAVEVWHPEVRYYEVYDEESGEILGAFYADWYPRESKRAGAWMDCLSCGLPPAEGRPRLPHLALMCGNLSRPSGDRPALLTHREVETVFHEFGHLLHQTLSNVEVRSLAGCNVAWDFVELPSQINENWTWEPEAIDRYARHWQSGELMPEALKRKMIAARNCGAASDFMRQLCFGKLDLELHVHTARYLNRDVEEVDREILADYRVPLTEQGPSMLRAFSHIFDGGYESGYYSYKWAEMLEADAFRRFAEEGVFNPQTGRDFRRCILSQGNSRPAAELFRDFMHRDPDPEALLRRSGIIS